MAGELGADHKTVAARTRVLEDLFLLTRLQPWHVNLSSRQLKTPKLYMTDTGLLAHLMNLDAKRIVADGTLADPVHARDFAGLRPLRDRLGERFKAGVVLYTGERTLSFGERLTAVPLCGLWA